VPRTEGNQPDAPGPATRSALDEQRPRDRRHDEDDDTVPEARNDAGEVVEPPADPVKREQDGAAALPASARITTTGVAAAVAPTGTAAVAVPTAVLRVVVEVATPLASIAEELVADERSAQTTE